MNANIRQPATGRVEVGRVEAYDKGGRSERLAARLEPFDSYWQAPKDVEKGFTSFTAYYRANYLGHMPADKGARILVISNVWPLACAIAWKSILLLVRKRTGTSKPLGEYVASAFACNDCKSP